MIDVVNRAKPESILEIGVGPGLHLHEYAAQKITVVDVSSRMIEKCRKFHPMVHAYVMDGECLAFNGECFDVVALPHVLSVTANPTRMIEEAHRVLRKGGKMVILNYDAHEPLVKNLSILWSWLANWLKCSGSFRLENIPSLANFQHLERRTSGIINQFSLTLWKK